jgi:hypothetical protein
MISELHHLNLKLCSKWYNKIFLAPDCGAKAGKITTQPKQGRQAAPMSILCILLKL